MWELFREYDKNLGAHRLSSWSTAAAWSLTPSSFLFACLYNNRSQGLFDIFIRLITDKYSCATKAIDFVDFDETVERNVVQNGHNSIMLWDLGILLLLVLLSFSVSSFPFSSFSFPIVLI